ncbi:hypothetical protein ACJIZ3_005563 [Penstemon smallii]|uniref:RING-type E3 ubiquitin transferase n=1 Tax=Penstemon smallii TaxID=265156 RepID=A0ABD3S5L7_9LAMI
MNKESQRLSLAGDGGAVPTGNSIETSISHPFPRTSTHSDHQHRIVINDEPQDYCSDDDDDNDDESAAPLARNCDYARPFLFLDIIWNISFVLVSAFVLLTSIHEKPSTPLRFWICVYALQCFLHVGFVLAEYQRWNLVDGTGGVRFFRFRGVFMISSLCHNSLIKKLESINTIVSSIWWVFGFYWIVIGGQVLLQDSPRLYWLSVVFLAFDVFFLIFCIAMACVVFFVLFCCFPIVATVAYAMSIQEGASENDIKSLPKYIYRHQNALRSFENDKKQEAHSKAEFYLQPEDSECCICLYKYMDGTELTTLPCKHHFHHECIAKWLRINATCPLCKHNILRGDLLV